MAWIESHTVLMRHRKVAELARKLRVRRSHATGHLHALWHAALEQQEDGDLSSWSDEFITEMSDYSGDAPQYVRLLQECGFLDDHVIHDWLDYAGRFLTTKYSTSNKERLAEIWSKHGRVYGARTPKASEPSEVSEQLASGKRVESEPTTPNQPNLTKPNTCDDDPPDGFVRFWDTWPKHIRKAAQKKCVLAWKKQKCETLADQIVHHVEAFKTSLDWTKEDGQYVPAPLTYLSQRRWETPVPASSKANPVARVVHKDE